MSNTLKTFVIVMSASVTLIAAEQAQARPNAAKGAASAARAGAKGKVVSGSRVAPRNAKAGNRARVSNKRVKNAPKHRTHKSARSAARNRATTGKGVVRPTRRTGTTKRPTTRPTTRPKAAPSRTRSSSRPTINTKTHNRTPNSSKSKASGVVVKKAPAPTPKFRPKSAARAKTKSRKFGAVKK